MEIAMQIVSSDKTVRSDTKEKKRIQQPIFNYSSEKRRAISFHDACYQENFNLLRDDIVELHTENENLKNKIGSYDEKRLEDFKAKLLEQISDEKRANLTMSRMEKKDE